MMMIKKEEEEEEGKKSKINSLNKYSPTKSIKWCVLHGIY